MITIFEKIFEKIISILQFSNFEKNSFRSHGVTFPKNLVKFWKFLEKIFLKLLKIF